MKAKYGFKDSVLTETTSQYDQWKGSQEHWDDTEFLRKMTPLMRWRYERLDALVLERLREGMKGRERPLLVDLGCGRLEFLAALRRGPRPDWRYLGVDPSPEQLGNREARDGLFGLVRAAGEKIPLADMCADGVLIKEVIDHSYDPASLLREAYRILRPGGALVLTVTNDRSYYKLLFPGVNARLKTSQKDHLNFYGPSGLTEIFRTAPFDRVRVETYNYLKLPSVMERMLGWAGSAPAKGLLALADAAGRTLMPGLGGGLLVSARRPER